jgi:hypothetical protein
VGIVLWSKVKLHLRAENEPPLGGRGIKRWGTKTVGDKANKHAIGIDKINWK